MTPMEFLGGFETSKARPPSKFLLALLSSGLLQNNPLSVEHLTTFPAQSADSFHNPPQNNAVKFVTVIAYSLVPFSILVSFSVTVIKTVTKGNLGLREGLIIFPFIGHHEEK